MIKVYVAGPISSTNTMDLFNNIRKGQRVSTELLLEGYSPFVPFFDFHFSLNLIEGEKLSLEDYYNYSLEWLKVSDCVLVLPEWEGSAGVAQEIYVAKKYKIPIFYNRDSLEIFRKDRNGQV